MTSQPRMIEQCFLAGVVVTCVSLLLLGGADRWVKRSISRAINAPWVTEGCPDHPTVADSTFMEHRFQRIS